MVPMTFTSTSMTQVPQENGSSIEVYFDSSKICLNYSTYGSCAYGDQCRYFHPISTSKSEEDLLGGYEYDDGYDYYEACNSEEGGYLDDPVVEVVANSAYADQDLQNQMDRNSKQVRLFKTELCRSFTETNFCKYGERCQFAHGVEDLRPVKRHRKYKTERCRRFHEEGVCPFGHRCCFIHNEDPDDLPENPSQRARIIQETTFGNTTIDSDSIEALDHEVALSSPTKKRHKSADSGLSSTKKNNSSGRTLKASAKEFISKKIPSIDEDEAVPILDFTEFSDYYSSEDNDLSTSWKFESFDRKSKFSSSLPIGKICFERSKSTPPTASITPKKADRLLSLSTELDQTDEEAALGSSFSKSLGPVTTNDGGNMKRSLSPNTSRFLSRSFNSGLKAKKKSFSSSFSSSTSNNNGGDAKNSSFKFNSSGPLFLMTSLTDNTTWTVPEDSKESW